MRVLFIFADRPAELNTSIWLMRIPADSISRLEGHQAAVVHLDDVLGKAPQAVQLTQWADTIILERNFWNPVIDLVRALKNVGKLVIACFDDNYSLMSATNPSFSHWNKNLMRLPDGTSLSYEPGFLNEWKACLKEFHAYHTPAELLTQDWLHLNPRGYTINNYPDYNWPSWGVEKIKPNVPFIVGWGGGGSHFDSFNDSRIIPALKKLSVMHPHVQICIISADQRLPELLQSKGIAPPVLLYHPGTPLHNWPSLIPELDVAFVPLAGKYDDRRSWIKVLELGAQGVPWVAADRPPYRLDPSKPGEGYPGGFIVQDRVSSWVKYLSMLIEDRELRERLGKEGREWARAQDINDHICERLALYEQLLKELKAGKLDVPPVKGRPKKRRKRQRRKR